MYKTNVYDLRNKNFYMLVRGEERHQDVTTTKRNCYSIISNENTNIFGQGIMTTYGYNYLDVDRVLHIFEEDSYSSDLNENQGFLYHDNVIGLQFHFEPMKDNVREIAINDNQYPLENNDLHQTAAEIINHDVPAENKQVMFKLLNYITK